MALQTLKGGLWYPEKYRTDGGNPILNLTLDAVGESAGFVVQVPFTGTIDRIRFSLMASSVTSGPLNFPARLENVGSDGLPDGTLLASGSEATAAISSGDANSQLEVTLTTPVAVVQGEDIAFVLNAPGSGTFAVQLATLGGDFTGLKPYAHANGAKVLRVPVLSFRYDDTVYRTPVGCLPLVTIGLLDFNSGTTPDEAGNLYEFPFPCRIDAVWMFIDPDPNTTFNIVVTDESGTVRCNMTIDADVHATLGDGTVEIQLVPASGQNLEFAAGEAFRVTVVADATGFEIWYLTVGSAADMDMLDGGQLIHATERSDGAGEYSQITTRRYFQSVRICALDDGAGGGGGGSGIAKLVGKGLVG